MAQDKATAATLFGRQLQAAAVAIAQGQVEPAYYRATSGFPKGLLHSPQGIVFGFGVYPGQPSQIYTGSLPGGGIGYLRRGNQQYLFAGLA